MQMHTFNTVLFYDLAVRIPANCDTIVHRE